MSFVVKLRGALTGSKMAEYECADHGRFDAWVSRNDTPDEVPCSECGSPSPWVISAPLFKPQLACAAVKGKSDPVPHAMALDTRELGDGMPLAQWQKKRAAQWREHDRKKVDKDLVAATDRMFNKPDGRVR